jgi:hypothetical protein
MSNSCLLLEGNYDMPTIFAFTRHSPENCPLTNEKIRKMVSELIPKATPLREKYGIKIVGSWTVAPEHLTISVLEVPNVDAWVKYTMEPEVLKYSALQTTNYFKVATTLEESMKLLE